MMRSATTNARGFTLIELAVVIAIVALLLGALLVPLATQIQGRNVRETQLALKDIKQALVGFAVTQGRLPCPDTDRDGFENAACGNWTDYAEGFLPWQDLAVTPTDAWGRVFRYAVSSEFTYASVPGAPPATNRLDLTDDTLANITIITRGDDPGAGAGALPARAPTSSATSLSFFPAP
jgi:prepilin-type N-terminal cleavage/methylation domain-containing protein